MNTIKHIFLCAVVMMMAQTAQSQGCVAIRNMSCAQNAVAGSTNAVALAGKGDIVVNANYRYFKSFRHFRGTHEEKNRIAEGTEVINHFNGLDLGVSYGITNRLTGNIIIPFAHNARSSMYEHYGNSVTANPDRKRFNTGSFGLSDIRLSLSYWLLDPMRMPKGNIAIGAGVKLPTGNYKLEGDFHRRDQEGQDYTTRRPLDQSIQLGDGGFGINLETQGYWFLFDQFSMFFSGFYMATPRNTNNVLRNPTANADSLFNHFSVGDQYGARLGLGYATRHGFLFNLGGRLEGIPATDLIGKSEGFRRPGYIISVEPGIGWQSGPLALNINVPVALSRNRIKNTRDKQTAGHGDAAFADYVINVGATYLIHTKKRNTIHIIE